MASVQMEEDIYEENGEVETSVTSLNESNNPPDSTPVMSEKVQNLANSLYQEFESMISRYGEEVVEKLMPIAVGMLESMNMLYNAKNESEIELELLREDSDQLMRQYERERQGRRIAEENLIALEDHFLVDKRTYEDKISSLESIVHMLEIKSKNTQDLVNRMEEKENELRREYQRLDERYRDLLRSNINKHHNSTTFDYPSLQRSINHLGGGTTTPSQSTRQLSNNKRDLVMISSVYSSQRFPPSHHQQQQHRLPDEPDPTGRLHRSSSSFSTNKLDTNNLENILMTPQATTPIPFGISSQTNLTSTTTTTTPPSRPSSTAANNTQQLLDMNMSSSSGSGNSRMITSGGGDATALLVNSSTSKQQQHYRNQDETNNSTANNALLDSIEQLGNSEGDGFAHMNPLEVKKQQLVKGLLEIIQPVQEMDSDSDYEQSIGMKPPSLMDEIANADQEYATIEGMKEPMDDNYSDDEDENDESYFGISREIDNILKENDELIKTKNALNVVKTDLIHQLDAVTLEKQVLHCENIQLNALKSKLLQQKESIEREMIEMKQQLQSSLNRQREQEDDEADVPLSQRKRFTRMEMARVLMERNQYKERLMELQEAVKWTEMLRASREHPDLVPPKKKSSIWNTFANLFGKSRRTDSPTRGGGGGASAGGGGVVAVDLAHSSPRSSHLQNNQSLRVTAHSSHSSPSTSLRGIQQQHSGTMFDSSSLDSSNPSIESSIHVMMPWQRPSQLISRNSASLTSTTSTTTTGGGGGSLLSINDPSTANNNRIKVPGWTLSARLTSSQRTLMASTLPQPQYCRPLQEEQKGMKIWCAAATLMEQNDTTMESSVLWVCTSTTSESQVIILDAAQPSQTLNTFFIKQSHALCIASVRRFHAALDVDQNLDFLRDKCDSWSVELDPDNVLDGRYTITLCQCIRDEYSHPISDVNLPAADSVSLSSTASTTTTETAAGVVVAAPAPPSAAPATASLIEVNSSQATMWIGCQSGHLFVHSAVANHRHCLHCIHLKDSVICVLHVDGFVFVGLADGTVCVFSRDCNSQSQWDLSRYACIDLRSLMSHRHSVKVIVSLPSTQTVWIANQNSVFVVNNRTLRLVKKFDAHPRRDAQIRDMCHVGDGVWLSIRLDSTIRLYHATTLQHLQDVDLTPDVSQVIDFNKLRCSHVSVSALQSDGHRLWVGTKNGVVACLSYDAKLNKTSSSINNSVATSSTSPTSSASSSPSSSFIPTVKTDLCALSIHAHQDAVKFLVTVNNIDVKTSVAGGGQLMISGGEGYIDLRNSEIVSSTDKQSRYDKSHLIVWRVGELETIGNNNENKVVLSSNLATTTATPTNLASSTASASATPTTTTTTNVDTN